MGSLDLFGQVNHLFVWCLEKHQSIIYTNTFIQK